MQRSCKKHVFSIAAESLYGIAQQYYNCTPQGLILIIHSNQPFLISAVIFHSWMFYAGFQRGGFGKHLDLNDTTL